MNKITNKKECIYTLFLYSVKNKTEDDWKEELRVRKATYPSDITLEEYKEKQRRFNKIALNSCEESFDYLIEASVCRGFYSELEKVEKVLKDNLTDVWEGCYDYAVVVKIPLNYIYPQTYTKLDETNFYYYDKDLNGYIKAEDFPKRDLKLEKVLKTYGKADF